jgi:hypothetical protein
MEAIMTPVRTAQDALPANLARAYRRAVSEGLVAYPAASRRWTCKDYTIEIIGPTPLDVSCDCADAVFRERLCKHAACVVFYRLYGLVPCAPAAATGISKLPDCVDDFVATLQQKLGAVAA